MTPVTRALLVLVSTAAIDVVWTYCVLATTERRGGAAASWAAVLTLLGAFNTLSIVGDYRLALPAACGAWIGTWFAVHRK